MLWFTHILRGIFEIMRSKGLKINMTITLVSLLTAGIFMVNFVVTILWQRDLISSEIRVSRSIITVITQQFFQKNLADFDISSSGKDIESIIEQAKGVCGALYQDNRYVLFSKSSVCGSEQLRQLLKEVHRSGAESRKTFGNNFGRFFPGKRYLAVGVPIKSSGQALSSGSFALVFSLSPLYQSIRDSQRVVYVYIFVNVLILSVIGFFRFVKLTVKPLERLVSLTDSYSEKDGVPLFISREGDEFGQLSVALNKMMQRIENDRQELIATVDSLKNANQKLHDTQREMIQAEKLASVGRLAAGLAHEIGNPVSIVQGYIELIGQEHLTQEEMRDFASRADQELQRISGLIRQMLDLARSSSGNCQVVHFQKVIDELVEVVRAQPMMSGIKIISIKNDDFDQVWCDSDQLRQVLLNCLINAVDAIAALEDDRQGEIEIISKTVVGNKQVESSDILTVMIKDNGVGIVAEKLDTIFDPFFTSKEIGKGTGLGLFVSHSIVERFGGRMRAESVKREGATIIIELPLYKSGSDLQGLGQVIEMQG